MNGFENKLEGYKQLVKKIRSYDEALGLLYWDLRTGAPKKAVEGRSEVIGLLSGEMFKLTVSDEMGDYINELTRPEVQDRLGPIERKMLVESKKEYERSKKIPQDRYEAYVVLTSKAESVWEEAKPASDFARFQPYLEQIVAFQHEFIERWGYGANKYDTLLDQYEPGMTVAKLDEVFGALRKEVVPLLASVQQAGRRPDTGFLRQRFPKEQQRAFNLFILKEMGYDFAAGRLDETVHPFATGLNPGDVRITTKFEENDLTTALFGTIHEGGHALYEQNISPELRGTNLCSGTSMGIHESQSRFWENMIGLSEPFWTRYFGDLQRAFPGAFDDMDAGAFYRAVNVTEPTLIRIEADELTYNLHIMVRYEIEKALFDGSVRVADLPEAWNAKYKDYLGIEPANDGEGVLQDVHWSGGSFGYFPSYALGNMYAAQIRHTLASELGNLDGLIAEGRLQPIKEWLTDKIYRHGKLLDPSELILQVTGEELNPNYLVHYLKEKYSRIYGL
ncbi:carboxypeptidase M32 [Paenibacillus sp. J31TS4]|uniref:carboxypeptidase M32 n=1 Tax=Paenibacillus sp. J31TS4 TaxID=2807195 RepID=UPI001B05EA1E|nr:carboxypeptidase M32 [Paenibacillus sp. J31TS4]GIP37347.1 carboxypeptidase M32 [Paenibacillus sp. J31TS4]